MNLIYWCPYLSKVATVRAVLNSAISIKQYSKNKLNPQIINSIGEWNEFQNLINNNNIDLINLFNFKNFYKNLPKNSYLKSRISFFLISIITIKSLYKFLKKRSENDIFIIHLISVVPLILSLIFNFKCKFILRISGYPKLNFFRKYLWKLSNKNLSGVMCPTLETYNDLIKGKIFDQEKCHVLFDPILEVSKFKHLKKEKIESYLLKNKYIINIGRLSEQKNHSFLIKSFKKILEFDSSFNLVILGEGELKSELELLSKQLKIEDKIFFLGHVKNVFKYLSNAKYFVLTSKWEDPGFVLLESAFSKTTIISADCPNGPNEILDNGKGGFIFKSNNMNSFIQTFKQAEDSPRNIITSKKKEVLKKSINYTKFRHYKNLKKIISMI